MVFRGKEEEVVPEMTEIIVRGISERYIELYENITGEKFVKGNQEDIQRRVQVAILDYLAVN